MQKYVIANWKSNKSQQTAQSWLDSYQKTAASTLLKGQVEVVIAPPFSLLETVKMGLSDHTKTPHTSLGVQDISPFAAGSYTGAVAAENLQGLGVTFAILGHSERRRHFHESHQDVANKVARCIEASITPVVCVDNEYIEQQAQAIAGEHLEKCLVAYEELGAIGTGDNQDPDTVGTVVTKIKAAFGQTSVLYGGSVKPLNAQQYAPLCEGVLVGGASLDAEKLLSIAQVFSE